MRNMSFALTTEQVLEQTKSVTRRFGWKFLKVGDLVQPVLKSMGLKKGESIEKLGCPIRIIKVSTEPLYRITSEDCRMEGFPEFTPPEFVAMIMKHYKLKDQEAPVQRIEFEYTDKGKYEVGSMKDEGDGESRRMTRHVAKTIDVSEIKYTAIMKDDIDPLPALRRPKKCYVCPSRQTCAYGRHLGKANDE